MNDDSAPVFESGENGISLDNSIDSIPRQDTRQEQPNLAPKKKKPIGKIIALAIGAIAIAAVIIVAINLDYRAISDQISAIGYEMPADVAKLYDELKLTTDGDRIFKATRPELQKAEDFNSNCSNEDRTSSVLGCYKNDRIYVYNIISSELDGIRQSTLAHELLHAVWSRISENERNMLLPDIEETVKNETILQDHLKLYSQSSYYDEAHSIIGTQIPPERMTEKLRAHYSKYFSDISAVYNQFNKYKSVYDRYEKRAEELFTQIEEYRTKLKEMGDAIGKENEKLKDDINSYNERTRNDTYAGTVADMEREYQELLKRQNDLVELNNEYRQMAEAANKLVEEYNSNALRTRELADITNSHANDN